MSTDLATFNFSGDPIRVVHIGDQPWWVATDLSAHLGYRLAPHMLRMLDDDQKGIHKVDTLGGVQEVSIVNESGMWTCVIRSKRPEAVAFRRFLTVEVLPALRRNGFYAMPGVNLARPASVAEFLRLTGALKLERNRSARAALLERLHQVTDSWGVQRIPNDGIGWADPDHSELLAIFWNAVRAVEAAGHTVNHSRRNHLIAINLPEIRQHFHDLGCGVEVDSALAHALRQSANPPYLADKTVNCRDGKSRHCWIFSTYGSDGAQPLLPLEVEDA